MSTTTQASRPHTDPDPSLVLVDGGWRPARAAGSFTTTAPATGARIATWPVSEPADVEAALTAATAAAQALEETEPAAIAAFLDHLAALLDDGADELVRTAALETGLDQETRLRGAELPRTVDQLRQAAEAARLRRWRVPQLSPASRIAALRAPIPGPVVVLGPNNFPLAFNPLAGGDFAAAVATHHPVLALANPGHPMTTALLAELGRQAAVRAGLPPATVQLLHAVPREAGLRLVADRRIAAVAHTGSRRAGLALKAAADAAGIPLYTEMSASNPVVVLPGAARERAGAIADQLAGSILGSAGQLCTKPGILLVPTGAGDDLAAALAARLEASDALVVLGPGIAEGLAGLATRWTGAGARALAGSTPAPSGPGVRVRPRLFEVGAAAFCEHRELLGTEAFGPMALLVRWEDEPQLLRALRAVEPSLTGTIYTVSDAASPAEEDPAEEELRRAVAAVLAARAGRLLENKVPTGVAVVPAMHHGGPYPSTGHPGFTSVGIPESLARFTARRAFDNVEDRHLPPELRADNPLGLVREVDGVPTTDPIVWGPR